MKTPKWIVPALLLGMSTVGIAGCSKTEQQPKTPQPQQSQETSPKTVQYTCSMHPEVVQNGPGKCPKCGMQLIEKR